MRDAVKRALPSDAPKPGKFRVAGSNDTAPVAEAPTAEVQENA